jgi:hypothetical protein
MRAVVVPAAFATFVLLATAAVAQEWQAPWTEPQGIVTGQPVTTPQVLPPSSVWYDTPHAPNFQAAPLPGPHTWTPGRTAAPPIYGRNPMFNGYTGAYNPYQYNPYSYGMAYNPYAYAPNAGPAYPLFDDEAIYDGTLGMMSTPYPMPAPPPAADAAREYQTRLNIAIENTSIGDRRSWWVGAVEYQFRSDSEIYAAASNLPFCRRGEMFRRAPGGEWARQSGLFCKNPKNGHWGYLKS